MNFSSPSLSFWLMRLTYLVAGVGLFIAMELLGNGEIKPAAAWTSGLVIGGGDYFVCSPFAL